MPSTDPITPLSSVLTIEKANDAERMYLIKIKESTNDSADQEDTIGLAIDNSELMMTGILNGNEKYIRYCKGEIMTIYDNNIGASGWAPDPVTETPRFVQKLNAIRKFITDSGHPL